MLGAMTTTEAATAPILLIPLGATEQHGPHLPLDTDTRIAVALANRVASQVSQCAVAPALAFGASGEHQGFAGTMSIGNEALQAVIIELARCVSAWTEAVVFVSGHGGNHQAMNRAVDQLRHEGHTVRCWSPHVAGADAHAGHTETSIMLALHPELVRMDRAEAGAIESLSTLMPELVAGGVRAVSANGVLGDPQEANAADGRRYIEQMTVVLASVVATLGESIREEHA